MLCVINTNAQDTYTINGETYQLKTEVNGSIDLLWNIIDGQYRYFIKKDNSIEELVNTKGSDGTYQEQYISTLKSFSSDATISYDKVKLLLYSLKDFVNEYNATVDSSYSYNTNKIAVKTRLGFFGGMTNIPFVTNPDNDLSPTIAAEFELYDDNIAKRHAAFIGLRHIFKNKELQYSSTEASLGYRYRFIYKQGFNIYANVKLATFTASKNVVTYLDESDQQISREVSGNSFDAPVIFGLGADIKITENGFLTLSYGELFALFFDNGDNFSTDFSIGYKFNL